MLEFDHERNRKEGLDPDKVTLGSNKKLHWICRRCPKGRLHRWQASPYTRIGNGRNCHYCSSQKVCLCNSLQGCFPALAEEWDSVKNGLEADQVIAQSRTMAFWKGKEGHTWEQAPCRRVAALKGKRNLPNQGVSKHYEWSLRHGIVILDLLYFHIW